MGVVSRMTCQDCGHRFRLQRGAGMIASVYFCEDCGLGTSVPNERSKGRPHLEDVDEKTRRLLIETGFAGICKHCHGELSPEARPACTRCGSRRLEDSGVEILWD